MSAKIKKQIKLDIVEKNDFRREKLLERYMARILYGQDDEKFKTEYLRKLEKN